MTHAPSFIADYQRLQTRAGLTQCKEFPPMTDDLPAPIRDRLAADNAELRQLLAEYQEGMRRLCKLVDDTNSDSEGRYPIADCGCIQCTLGTVPNNLNTGRCAYHAARALLARPLP